MADVEALVQQGIAAIKAGRKDEAKRVLSQAIELDEHNEKAWLYMSGCVETPEEQQICLENVLSINPANEKARKGLDALNKAIKKPAAPPADPFGGAGSNDPFASGGFGSSFDSNPFAGTGFESNPYAGSDKSDPAVGSGWGTFDTGGFDTSFNSPVPDAPASSPTSVEWGATGAPAHGSGKNVAQPSADEYDSWVAGLSLPNTDNSGGSSFGGGYEASDPFGSNFGSTPSDPFVADPFTRGAAGPSPFDAPISKSPASQPDPFGSFGSSSGDEDPFGGPFSAAATSRESSSYDQDDPFADNAPVSKGKGSSYQSSYQDDDPFASSPASASRSFAQEEADPLADIFSDDMGSSVSSYGAASQPKKPKKSSEFSYIDTATMTGMQTYFDAIPAEIKGKKGGSKASAGVLVSVLVLLVLNVVSIGLLVVNFMNH